MFEGEIIEELKAEEASREAARGQNTANSSHA